jgi:hypothetical protein
MSNFKDIPNEVWNVWVIQARRQPIGSEMMDKVNDIIERNPKYFAWEHKYKAIPDEVHDAFQRECYPEKFKPIEFDNINVETGGIDWAIKNMPNDFKPLTKLPTKKEVLTFWQMLDDDKKERLKRQEEIKRIWNKHYGKYKLECREF